MGFAEHYVAKMKPVGLGIYSRRLLDLHTRKQVCVKICLQPSNRCHDRSFAVRLLQAIGAGGDDYVL